MSSKEVQPRHTNIRQQLLDGICESDDPAQLYSFEMNKISSLTASEESQILDQLKARRDARQKLLVSDSMVSEHEQNIARQQIYDGDLACNRFVEANQRLVISVAKHFLNRGVQYMDLIQEGNMGFIKGIEKYDFRPETKLTTYATFWIRQAMGRLVENQSETIRLPSYVQEHLKKYAKTKAILVQELGRNPHDEEIAVRLLDQSIEELVQKNKKAPSKEEMPELLQNKLKHVQWMHQVMRTQPVDLDAPAFSNDDKDVTFGELLAVPEPEPEDTVGHHSSVVAVQTLLSTLSSREERVLLLRHGFVDGKMYTLDEVGKEMDISRERVRQIEKRALERLRTQNNQRKLFAEEAPILSVDTREAGNKKRRQVSVQFPDEIRLEIIRDARRVLLIKYACIADLYFGSLERDPMSFDAIAEQLGTSSRNIVLNFNKFLQRTYGVNSILQLQDYVTEHQTLPSRLQ